MIFHLTVRMRACARTGSPHCIRYIFHSTYIFSYFFIPSLYPFLSVFLSFFLSFASFSLYDCTVLRFASRLSSLGARRKPRAVVAKGKNYANTLTNTRLTQTNDIIWYICVYLISWSSHPTKVSLMLFEWEILCTQERIADIKSKLTIKFWHYLESFLICFIIWKK